MSKLKNIKSVRYRSIGRFLMPALLLTACFSSCRDTSKPTQIVGFAQGTYYNILYIDPQHRDLQHYVDSLLDRFDLSASLWVDSSLLRRLNANLTDTLDDNLLAMLNQSLFINQYTGGAFDVRIGRLVQAWGFSFKERSEPDEQALQQLLDAAHSPISIDGRRLIKASPETELDFNAIAQGYSVDLLARHFDNLGIHDYLIDVGGEVIAHGKKGNKSWRVGIEQPSVDSTTPPVVITSIPLDDASVVTSGNYRKFYERDGIRYSHTISPATGRPVNHSLLSVSVVDSTAWLADAMATAYMVMGLDSAKTFIQNHQGQAGTGAVYFIYDSLGEMKTYATPQFENLISNTK